MSSISDSPEIENLDEEEIYEREVAPAEARKVTEAFTEMRAWQMEMKRDPENATDNFFGSKRKFMESCRTIYPIEVIDASQAGIEIEKSRQELESLNEIPNLQVELAKKARNIRLEQVTDPLELIWEIDRIVEPTSRVVNEYIQKYPGLDFEAESQLDKCFREIYRLEILRETLESTLSEEEKKDLISGQEGSDIETKESPEASEMRVEEEVEANWDRLLKEQFKMSLDEWIREGMPGDIDWTMFGSNTEKSEKLHNGMNDIKQDFHDDDRMITEKTFDYKVRLNELLKKI